MKWEKKCLAVLLYCLQKDMAHPFLVYAHKNLFFCRNYPSSTIAFSSAVKPYSSYTILSISLSVVLRSCCMAVAFAFSASKYCIHSACSGRDSFIFCLFDSFKKMLKKVMAEKYFRPPKAARSYL